MKNRIYLSCITILICLATDPAIASRLESAARNAQSSLLTIAQITSGIGIAIGGILLSVGWGSVGRQVLAGGAIGAFASFGGPAAIEFVRGLF